MRTCLEIWENSVGWWQVQRAADSAAYRGPPPVIALAQAPISLDQELIIGLRMAFLANDATWCDARRRRLIKLG